MTTASREVKIVVNNRPAERPGGRRGQDCGRNSGLNRPQLPPPSTITSISHPQQPVDDDGQPRGQDCGQCPAGWEPRGPTGSRLWSITGRRGTPEAGEVKIMVEIPA